MTNNPRKLKEIVDSARLQAHKQLASMSEDSINYLISNYAIDTTIKLDEDGNEATVDIKLVKRNDVDES